MAGILDLDSDVFNALLGYLGRKDVMKLRLVSLEMNKAVGDSDRIFVTVKVCYSGVTLKFGDKGRDREVVKDRVSDAWLRFVREVDWCSVPSCQEDGECVEDEAAISDDFGADIVYDVWEMFERVSPPRFKHFQIRWKIPFGWPKLETFVSMVNESKLSCTVEMTITGDERKPTFASSLTFGSKFFELTVTDFAHACDFFDKAQLDTGCRVERLTFIEMFESTLEAIDRFVKPAKSVVDLELTSICLEMSRKQPSRLFGNVNHLTLNAVHFHTSTVKKYGTCPVYRLSIQGSFPFQQMYEFPHLHDLEIQTGGPEDTVKFKHLLKGIHRLDVLAYSPQCIPTAKAFKHSQICHVELVMFRLTDAIKQAHPRFFAPVKQLKHLTNFGLLLDFREADPGPILQVGNPYHSLILDFIEELIKARNCIVDIKIGIQSKSQVDKCIFHDCDQTLVFNRQKVSKLKSLYK